MTELYSGTLFIVAAPSGGGKTSLVNQLIHQLKGIVVSISHTTRAKRPGEVDGVDYFFIDQSQFMSMVQQGAFVEHAHVFQHFYGTSVLQIEDRLRAGMDVVLDIDWQGARQIRHLFADAVSIFIIPPSLDVLKDRLHKRQQDDATVIDARMQRAQDELRHYSEFDYLIVNDDFATAAASLCAIVTAHRLRMVRQASEQQKLLSLLLSAQ